MRDTINPWPHFHGPATFCSQPRWNSGSDTRAVSWWCCVWDPVYDIGLFLADLFALKLPVTEHVILGGQDRALFHSSVGEKKSSNKQNKSSTTLRASASVHLQSSWDRHPGLSRRKSGGYRHLWQCVGTVLTFRDASSSSFEDRRLNKRGFLGALSDGAG